MQDLGDGASERLIKRGHVVWSHTINLVITLNLTGHVENNKEYIGHVSHIR